MADEFSMRSLEERLRLAGREGLRALEPQNALLRLRMHEAAPPLQLGPYSVVRYLGGGATGRVYEALDVTEDQRVALKILQDRGPETEQLLKREARALSRISHPNLVTFLEARVDEGVCYLAMELVEGTELTDYLGSNAAIGGRSTAWFVRLRSAIRQLASALAALHAARMVHRDVKPSNVLVTAAGRLVLVDLGLCRAPYSLQSTFSGHTVGTPAYMSPEQFQRGDVGAPSDCYAIGVILFEALVGEIPLSAESHEDLARLRVTAPAPRPSDFVDGVPSDLDDLCWDLLETNPEARPTCSDILERLGTELTTASTLASPELEDEPDFVGRRAELAALNSALAARTTRCVALVIGGPAGIGKSTLVEHFLRSLAPERHVVIAAKCYECETLPNKTIDALMDALVPFLKRLSAQELQGVLPRNMHELARMFPSLLRVQAFASASRRPARSDEVEQKQRALAALSELLGRIADRYALILWIDDLQWGDYDSVALIQQLLSSVYPPNCLCIGSFRTDSEPELLARRFFRRASDSTSSLEVRTLKLDRLSESEAEELAHGLMGDGLLETAQRVARESQGSPFLIAQLAAHSLELQDAAAARPATLSEVVAARLARLSAPSIEALRLVALAGSPIEQRVIAAAARLPDETVFHELRTAHLVRSLGRRGRVELYHAALVAAILDGLGPQTVRTLHARLAQSLIERCVHQHERIAFHLQAAGQHVEAAEYLLMGAERANRVLAHRRAARLYRLALDTGLSGDRARKTRAAYAHALRKSGRGLEAAEAYLEAALGEPDAWQRFELRRRAAQEFLLMGRPERGRALLEELMPAVQLSLPRSRLSAIAGLLARRACLRLRGIDFKLRPEQELSRSQLARLDTIWLLGQALVMIDPLVGSNLQSRHVLLALRCGEPSRVARALALDAVFASYAGPSARARVERLLDKARHLSAEIDDPLTSATTTLWGAATAYFMGEPARALYEVDAAERGLRDCAGTAYELATSHLVVLGSLNMLGAWRAFGERAWLALDESVARGNRYQSVGLRVHTHLACLIADDVDGARREIQTVLDEWPHAEFHMQHISVFLGEARLRLYCGDGVAACEHLEAMWPAVERSMLLHAQFLLVEALSWRARAHALAYFQTRSVSHRRQALRHAAELGRRAFLGAAAHALSVRAAIGAADGDARAAVELWRAAALAYEREQLTFFAAIARYQAHRQRSHAFPSGLAERSEQVILESGVVHAPSVARMFTGVPTEDGGGGRARGAQGGAASAPSGPAGGSAAP